MLLVPQSVTAPTTITIHFKSPLFGPDLTTVTAVNAGMLRRDGTTTSLAFAIVSATSRELVAQYTFVGGEMTTTGAYFLAPQLSVQGGAVPSETIPLFVAGPYNALPQLERDAWLFATVPIPSAGNVKVTWASVAATGNASAFLPFMAFDLRTTPITITLWTALDGDVVELVDVYNAAGSHALTVAGAGGQLVPKGDGTYVTSQAQTAPGFALKWRFRASDSLWIPRG